MSPVFLDAAQQQRLQAGREVIADLAWGEHPYYYRIGNTDISWQEKADRAKQILSDVLNG
ncbi:MAG: hypothetical protein JW726_20215 [Anaerolineales bacterium]|nr:hypothetical protein [Anaerolineales bacterium]